MFNVHVSRVRDCLHWRRQGTTEVNAWEDCQTVLDE